MVLRTSIFSLPFVALLGLPTQVLCQATEDNRLDTSYSVEGRNHENLFKNDGKLFLVRYDSLDRILSREQVELTLDTLTSYVESVTTGGFDVHVNFQPAFIRVGVAEEYWPSGTLRAKGLMCGGLKCGDWLDYDESGLVLSRRFFIAGVLQP